MRHPDDPTPTRILEDHPHHADPSAVLNLSTHLGHPRSKTTSGVLRYLALALNSVATADGRALCTPTPDDPDGFDMTDIIRAAGPCTCWPTPTGSTAPGRCSACSPPRCSWPPEHLALRQPGVRLRVPFIAVLDELRYGVTVPNLPYVASSQRKYGIGFVYSVQSSSQEEAVYGNDAAALRDAAGVTIIGGIDINLAKELSDRAGTTTVVTAARGTGHRLRTHRTPGRSVHCGPTGTSPTDTPSSSPAGYRRSSGTPPPSTTNAASTDESAAKKPRSPPGRPPPRRPTAASTTAIATLARPASEPALRGTCHDSAAVHRPDQQLLENYWPDQPKNLETAPTVDLVSPDHPGTARPDRENR
jgi:hypothetical protein